MLEDYSAQVQPMASWSSARGVWVTSQMNLLCEHLELFSEVWPTSGMMRNGVVYAQQMQAHRMEGIGFSSRLGPRAIPTPTVSDAHWSDTKVTRAVTKSQPYRGLGLNTWADRAAEGNLDVQPGLPTPTTRDYKDGAIVPAKHRPNDKDTLVRAMASVKDGSVWGQYEPAIRRWESITGREAPAPTIPDGRDGQQRLSPLLTEWMMGLPEGWITSPEIGISRNDQIKAAGNGVVPQQAVLALRYLLRKGDDE